MFEVKIFNVVEASTKALSTTFEEQFKLSRGRSKDNVENPLRYIVSSCCRTKKTRVIL